LTWEEKQEQGGDICPECGPHHFMFLEEFREFLATRPVGDVINLAKECIGQIVDDYEDYYDIKAGKPTTLVVG
jgi:hypothetical protein